MKLPPLLSVSKAAELAGMSPKALRRWLTERRQHYPDLVQGSPRKWLIQAAALGVALGRDKLDLEHLSLDTASRVDNLERRVGKLEARAA